MRIENVTLREVQEIWESNRRYSAAARSPELLALTEAISKMDVGSAKAIMYAEGRNPSNVRLQVQKASKFAGKNVSVVIDEINRRVMFSVIDRPPRRRTAAA